MGTDTVGVEKATTTGAASGNGAPGNTTTAKPITSLRIAQTLEVNGFTWALSDARNVYTILPTPSGERVGFFFFLHTEGHRTILQILATTDRAFALSRVPAALRLCNAFHTTTRYGTAIVDIDEQHNEARLCFEAQVDLTDGASAAFLHTFLQTHMAAGCHLFKSAREYKGLYPASPRKRSKPAIQQESSQHK